MIFVTSDHHFNHANIIKYTNRPFKSVEHMNMELVRRWNNAVDGDDLVIHLGDFCFNRGDVKHRDWENRLNGKIVFLQGNHDNHKEAPLQSLVFKYGGTDWWCCHYPEPRYRYNLCGHVHELWRIQRRGRGVVVNCSVDVWDYTPVSIEEIQKVVQEYI